MIGRAPAFWARRESLAGRLLQPIGTLVGHVTLRRMAEAGMRADVPVLCIGNPTVGGAGKTPTALLVLETLAARGGRPFALLRGHGGRLAGPIQVDPTRHGAADVGDEALLLAQQAPTIVSRDRPAGARLAVQLGASHIVMDDGFQNPSLAKDASLLVIDGAAGIGNGRVLPAGPLRAPLVPQLAAADGVLVIGPGAAGDAVADLAHAAGILVLRGTLMPDPAAVAALKGRPVLAFAGIGRPEKFVATLAKAGLDVARVRAFADHHPYAPGEIAGLIAEAGKAGLQPVTTTKDMARLGGAAFATLRPHLAVLPVRLVLDAPSALEALVAQAERRGAP